MSSMIILSLSYQWWYSSLNPFKAILQRHSQHRKGPNICYCLIASCSFVLAVSVFNFYFSCPLSLFFKVPSCWLSILINQLSLHSTHPHIGNTLPGEQHSSHGTLNEMKSNQSGSLGKHNSGLFRMFNSSKTFLLFTPAHRDVQTLYLADKHSQKHRFQCLCFGSEMFTLSKQAVNSSITKSCLTKSISSLPLIRKHKQ